MNSRSGHSPYRDRTQEFIAVAERLTNKPSSSATNAQICNAGCKFEGAKSAVSILSEFNKRASKISLGLHQTSQKVANLVKLAKRISVFDDPTVEIQELTAVIKEDFAGQYCALVDLELLCSSQNGSGNISSDTANHSSIVVDNLKNKLMSTKKEFDGVLTMRTENVKVHENRRQLFSSSTSNDAANPFVRQRPLISRTTSDSTAPPAPWESDLSSSSQLFSRKNTNGDPSSSTHPFLQQQQHLVPLQDSYMPRRAEVLQNVQSTVHELSNIFTQLNTVVSQQGEIAIRIDDNMEKTLTNVEGAQGQLLKYLRSISSNKWLMPKIFGVLLLVFLIFFRFFVA